MFEFFSLTLLERIMHSISFCECYQFCKIVGHTKRRLTLYPGRMFQLGLWSELSVGERYRAAGKKDEAVRNIRLRLVNSIGSGIRNGNFQYAAGLHDS
jgi:hypothetical protein